MDAFAGLAWDNSRSQKPQNNTLGDQQQRQLTPAQSSLSSSSDSFGKLASAGQLPPTAPKPLQSTSNGGPSIAIPAANRGTANPSGGDPFGGLFARGGSPNINMSMADRRAHAERERRERERREKEKLEAQGAMWDQLDSTFSANGSNTHSRTASPSPAIFPTRTAAVASPPIGLKTNPGVKVATSPPPPSGTDLFWSMHHSPQSASSRTSSPALIPQRLTPSTRTVPQSGSLLELGSKSLSPQLSHKNDAWSQIDVLAAPRPSLAPTKQPTAGLDPFDLDFLSGADEGLPQPTSHQPTPPRSRARTPGDFDFNERESFDSGVSTDEDDILGDLAKPVVERVATPEVIARAAPRLSTSRRPSMSNETRMSSPPPHILGQIVEMGFTPHQARVALAATDTGVNVEAALESLLAVEEDFTSSEPYRRVEHPRPPQRSRQTTRDTIEIPPLRASGTSTPASVAGIQPDKLLAQASEIGFSMFSKANAFWNQGKEAMQKAYEESLKTTGTPGAPADGRPKWMTGDTAEPITPDAAKTTFKDDSEVISPTNLQPEPASRSRPTAQASTSAAPPQSARNLLFEDEAPAYVSPHRRKPAVSTYRTDVASTASPARRAAPSPRPPPQPSRPKLVVPKTSPAAIASCMSSRTKGTEFFKLGQYADAESAYTTAITSIPPGHILLTSLYTNRAAARLKTGDSGGAVGDCTNVLKLMGVGDDMGGLMDVEGGKVWKFDGVPGGLDPREQAVKALQRRAAGLEMMERWDKARADWERLAGLNWTQAQGRVKEEATRSAARCRTLVNAATRGGGDANGSSPPTAARPAKPKPRPLPRRPAGPTGPSEASKRLKQAEEALENEENERIQLKDSVDSRIQGWKGGKEANIRALIASLETVLWPELGWVKVGMHELVTPSQVKIRYTKAIAKVHPDKLKTGNTTVEQRMLANGVFSGLNEAWGAFKQ